MMRKHGKSAANDPNLNAVLNSGVGTACLVGKTWDFHVQNALRISLKQNLEIKKINALRKKLTRYINKINAAKKRKVK